MLVQLQDQEGFLTEDLLGPMADKFDPAFVSPVVDYLSSEACDVSGEVYSVAGQYDLVAVLRCTGDNQIASLVTERMLPAEGVISSETLIAFRAFSQHDLERMFAIGLE